MSANAKKKINDEIISDEKKKENDEWVTRKWALIIGIIASYYFGYVNALTGKEGVIQAIISVHVSIFNKGRLFYNPIKGFLGILFGVVIVGGGTYLFMKLDSMKKFTTDMKTSAGSAGFMSKQLFEEYKENYIYKDPDPISEEEAKKMTEEELLDPERYSKNMPMSNSFSRPINSRKIIGNNNVLIVGGAGTGKSRFFIKPNLLQMNASYVITDPSGEMINSIGKVLVTHGYRLKVFNISDMRYSNTYNPLEYIRDEAGVNMLIKCLIDNTTEGKTGGDNQFFVDAERLLYSACIFYLKDYCTDINKKNFSGVLNLINSSHVDEKNTDAKSELDSLFDNLPKNSLARKYYTAFKQAAGKTLKSIIISCVTRLQPFMTPQVVNLTKRDDLELDKMGDQKTALFIITPQADRTYAFLASMLYSQLFETLYYKGEQQLAAGGSEQMKIPVRCMMDEFANIGTVPDMPGKLSTMRKYNISASIVLQDISQIEAMYDKEWKTLTGNCSSTIFLGSPEPNTLEYFSNKLGDKTIRTKSKGETLGKGNSSENYQYTSRKVMTEDELGRLSSDKCIVFTQNMRPFLDYKYKYENHPYYDQTADKDPDNAFEYKKITAFDNAAFGKYDSLFTALNEAARYKKATENIKNITHTGNPVTDANDSGLTPDNEEKIREAVNLYVFQKTAMLIQSEDREVYAEVVENTASKYLVTASEYLYQVTGEHIILFSDIHSNEEVLTGTLYLPGDISEAEKGDIFSYIPEEYIATQKGTKLESLYKYGENGEFLILIVKKANYKSFCEKLGKKD